MLLRILTVALDDLVDANHCDTLYFRYRGTITTMLHDFLLGFIKIHILHHAEQEPVYGLALIEELRRHDYELSPGTLYPVLHQLAREGYLVVEGRVVGGKVRKYYTITAHGSQTLAEVRHKMRELVDEVLEGHGPIHLPESDEPEPGDEGNAAND
jgi:DNA-binding PadR family transcriptional regulator